MEISILSMATLSAIGTERETLSAYGREDTALRETEIGGKQVWAGRLPDALFDEIEGSLSAAYRRLDPSVWYAIWTARSAVAQAGWQERDFGLNLGSSRGATQLWEQYHSQFRNSGSVAPPASPTTTLGNIASWVAHDLGCKGPALSHSITCSSALHAVLNGCAWIHSGFSRRFLAGGSEAPLTPFTLAQMEALKIYSMESGPYPCRPMDPDKTTNTMVLGEGAAMICMESGRQPGARAVLTGLGYGTETLSHGASLSTEAACLQRSMKMAISGTDPGDIDAIVAHAPGTLKGDSAELAAIAKVFENHLPLIYSNKWKIGHTFGASGMFNLDLAIHLLEGTPVKDPAYLPQNTRKRAVRKVLINAVGFGGNAVSLLVEKA